MAAVPKNLSDSPRRPSSSSSRKSISHGRGGAGNIGPITAADELVQEDLKTPTLKGEVYTTGRGGSGNMTKNIDPEIARRAQDVVAPPLRESESNTHIGRGGAANVFRPSQDDVDHARRDNKPWESETDEQPKTDRGMAEKGKVWILEKLRKV